MTRIAAAAVLAFASIVFADPPQLDCPVVPYRSGDDGSAAASHTFDILQSLGVDDPLDPASYLPLLADGVRFDPLTGEFQLPAAAGDDDAAAADTGATPNGAPEAHWIDIESVLVTEIRSLEGGPLRGSATINRLFDVRLELRAIGANAFTLSIAQAGSHTRDLPRWS